MLQRLNARSLAVQTFVMRTYLDHPPACSWSIRRRFSKRRRSRNLSSKAFTLVELLVVIGIISILIATLLPALASARRQGNSIKCLSALRQIGNGLQLYSIEYKGLWPVAVHAEGTFPGLLPPIPGLPIGSNERRWPDLLAKYVSGSKEISSAQNITEIRRNSVVWGCPEWTKSQEFDETNFADKVRVGYGMQYYPTYFYDGNKLDDLAYIRAGNVTGQRIPNVLGLYVKAKTWQRNSSERGIIADSITHIIQTPGAIASSSTWFPYDSTGAAPLPDFWVDARRHAKPGTKKKASYASVKGFNMLFADGHAAPVSVKEAWNAIHNPGQNKAGN